MNQTELVNLLEARPFEPFRLFMTDGSTYEILHPEMMVVGPRTAVVGVRADHCLRLFQRLVTLSLLHIVRVETLQPQETAGANP